MSNEKQLLTKPFLLKAHQFKPAATSGDRGLGLPYVDPRRYELRLDKVDSEWRNEYEVFETNERVMVLCTLTINGVTRADGGECSLQDDNAFTSALAQSFKRACAKFGLGRYLYFMPRTWADYDKRKRRFNKSGMKKLRHSLGKALKRYNSSRKKDEKQDQPGEQEQTKAEPSIDEKATNFRKELRRVDFTVTYDELIKKYGKEPVHSYLLYLRKLSKGFGAKSKEDFSTLISELFDVEKLTNAVGGHWLLLDDFLGFVIDADDRKKAVIAARKIIDKAVKEQKDFDSMAIAVARGAKESVEDDE